MRHAHSTNAARNRGLPCLVTLPLYAFSATGAFTRTQPGVRADGAPIPKALPRTDLACHHHRAQFSHTGFEHPLERPLPTPPLTHRSVAAESIRPAGELPDECISKLEAIYSAATKSDFSTSAPAQAD